MMRYADSLTLQSGMMVVAVRPGAALGIQYEAGTVGVIQVRNDTAGDRERKVRFTRSLTVDFSFFALQNWDVLTHCGECHAPALKAETEQCTKCLRGSMCTDCAGIHECTRR